MEEDEPPASLATTARIQRQVRLHEHDELAKRKKPVSKLRDAKQLVQRTRTGESGRC